jgi:hypothetical protein
VRAVQAVLRAPEEELDYARAKVALDLLIDPVADADWTFAELDRLTAAARRLAGSPGRTRPSRTSCARCGR